MTSIVVFFIEAHKPLRSMVGQCILAFEPLTTGSFLTNGILTQLHLLTTNPIAQDYLVSELEK